MNSNKIYNKEQSNPASYFLCLYAYQCCQSTSIKSIQQRCIKLWGGERMGAVAEHSTLHQEIWEAAP